MPKFKSLTNSQLKEVFRAYELPATGTKNEMVARLIEETETEEIDSAALKEILAEKENAMQLQINELRQIMENFTRAQNNIPQNETIENRINNNDVQAEENSLPRSSPVTVSDVEECNASTIRGGQQDIPIVRSLREASSVLPEFEPLKGPLTSRQFVDKVESIARAYNWPDELKLCAAQTKLRGHAKDWFDSQTVFDEWESFVEAFLLDFPSEINAADVHIQMIETRQARNETMVEYYYKMLAMGRRGKLEDRSIIKHAINGLFDTNVRQTLKATYFQNCPQFLKAILGMSQKGSRNNFYEGPSKETGAFRPGNYTRDTKPFRCYNCNEVGHMSKNCHKPQRQKRCEKCNKVQHSPGVTTCNGNSTHTRRVSIRDLMFLRTVKIEDKEFTAFIDTGSQCNMVRRSTVNKLCTESKPCALTIRGIGGGTQMAKECVTVDVEIDKIIFPVVMYVVNDDVIDEDMMLGQGLFANNEVKAMVTNGKVSFQLAKTECTSKMPDTLENDANKGNHDELESILDEYKDLFATGLQGIGKTDLAQMKIELDTETPLAQPPYRVPYRKPSYWVI